MEEAKMEVSLIDKLAFEVLEIRILWIVKQRKTNSKKKFLKLFLEQKHMLTKLTGVMGLKQKLVEQKIDFLSMIPFHIHSKKVLTLRMKY